jgi:hypothetical protein
MVLLKRFKSTTTENINQEGELSTLDMVADQFYSALRTRSINESAPMYDQWGPIMSMPLDLKMDYSRILQKPFLVFTAPWEAITAPFASLTNLSIPSAILGNALAKIPFTSTVAFRAKLCLMIQVAGTPMHSGTLLVTALPMKIPGALLSNRGSIMAAPHAFCHANESTAVCLEVPFYSNSKLLYSDPDENVVTASPFSDYAYVSFIVLNALVAPTSGSTAVAVNVHAMFKEIEFYAPHLDVIYKSIPNSLVVRKDQPQFWSGLKSIATGFIDGFFTNVAKAGGDFLDWARGSIRAYTGLHNPNTPGIESRVISKLKNFSNVVDCKTQFEKLDPYTQFDRIVNYPIFDTNIDEMDMRYILSKPYYIGTFNVNNVTKFGDILWSRPITPKQQILKVKTTPTEYGTNVPIQIFHQLSRYWRGSLKIHIQANMSNFHFMRLTLARNYSPVVAMLTQYPQLSSVSNLMTETMEFSAGGQIQTFELPYVSILDQLECAQSWATNALQHGMYYIIANSSLVTNGTVSPTINFNVYLSAGDDFQYFGYSSIVSDYFTSVEDNPYPPLVPPPTLLEEPHGRIRKDKSHAQIPEQTNLQDNLVGVVETGKEQIFTYDFLPIYSIRDYIRRFTPCDPIILSGDDILANAGIVTLRISDLIGNTTRLNAEMNTIQLINKMFLGYTGGIKFKFHIQGSYQARVAFIPPGTNWTTQISKNFSSSFPKASISTFGNPEVNNNVEQRQEINSHVTPFPVNYIDGTDFFRVTSNKYTDRDYASIYNTVGDSTIIEGVIPNMSPFRFVGDCAKAFDADDCQYRVPTSDLGSIIISFSQPWELEKPGDITSLHLHPVSIIPWIAATDEGRFGYQVLCPTIRYSYLLASGEGLLEGPYNMDVNHPAARAAPISDPLSQYPAAYFGGLMV